MQDPQLKALIVLLDRSAPSFCFYEVPHETEAATGVMDIEVLRRAAALARDQQLSLQIICGDAGLAADARDALRESPFICYAPPGACNDLNDVPILHASSPSQFDDIEKGRHEIAILRVGPDQIDGLMDAWQKISERVNRVVVVPLGLDRYSDATLAKYRQQLGDIRGRLATAYVAGQQIQLNIMSDRLALGVPRQCNAGIDHVTVDPSGKYYICPGFALDGSPSIGDLDSDLDIPNRHLLELRNAPICRVCDAFQCRRCVYLNRKGTAELNTPPQQVCRAAHAERDESRILLETLHGEGKLEELPAIPELAYDDPIEVVREQRKRLERKKKRPAKSAEGNGSDADTQRAPPPESQSHGAHSSTPILGRVTPAECDQIRALHQRSIALTTLFKTLLESSTQVLEISPYYDKLLRDMGTTRFEYQQWWDVMTNKYGWPASTLRIDFASREVYQDAAGDGGTSWESQE